MDVVLIVLGVLGLGAIVISAYVFTVAARNYVSSEERNGRKGSTRSPRQMVARNPTDRRRGGPVEFPLTVNGVLVMEDRRVLPDRRRAIAA